MAALRTPHERWGRSRSCTSTTTANLGADRAAITSLENVKSNDLSIVARGRWIALSPSAIFRNHSPIGALVLKAASAMENEERDSRDRGEIVARSAAEARPPSTFYYMHPYCGGVAERRAATTSRTLVNTTWCRMK